MLPLKDDNPTRTLPFVTIGLIAVNAAVYIHMVLLGPIDVEGFVAEYALVPAGFFGGAVGAASVGRASILTSMFMHGGLLHIGGNMLFLWIFGDNVEDRIGHVRFLLFYLACGLAAAFAHMLGDPSSSTPMIGASGAVSGVLGAYMLLFPGARVLTLVFVFLMWVPAALVIGVWITVQILSSMESYGTGHTGIAWTAHIGGFFAGMAIVLLMGGKGRGGGRYWR
ncbi:MAG: rhomboid family intramembrane serine protease [Nitrospirae bacterium]|nr:rhomboid family intramembrane serine protease [Nitrospirota bacterium]MBI5695713.1 rhomboid family intramembrane serine protease [Nitrospirota bacterium]